MFRRLAFFALGLGLSTTPLFACSAHEEDEEADEGAIIGGTPSDERDDAVMAIYRRGRLHCGATLIGRNVLLTALHCVSDSDNPQRTGSLRGTVREDELEIYMGTRPGSRPSATVSRILVPDPQRLGTSSMDLASNDVALLYIQPIDQRMARVQPLALASQPARRGTNVVVVGYGGDGNTSYRSGSAQRYPQQGLRGGMSPEDQIGVGNSGFGGYEVLRERRTVEVLNGTGERDRMRSNFSETESYEYANRPREFMTQAVACGGDSGGPAIDDTGRLVGVISAVVGRCSPGSFTTYTDVTAHMEWIRRALSGVSGGGYNGDIGTYGGYGTQYRSQYGSGAGSTYGSDYGRQYGGQYGYGSQGGCLDDSYCGDGRDGRVCDRRTGRCMIGCRGGSVECGSVGRCSLQTDPLYTQQQPYAGAGGATTGYRSGYGRDPSDYTYGRTGICRSTSTGTDYSDPLYDNGGYVAPRGVTCPGDARCPSTTTRECTSDTSCQGASAGSTFTSTTRICDTARGRCVDGCRVGQTGQCPSGQTCGASPEDPTLGVCQSGSVAGFPSSPTTTTGTDGGFASSGYDSDGGVGRGGAAESTPPASPPVLRSDPVSPTAPPPSTTVNAGDTASGAGGSTSGDAGKKNKAAPPPQEGCTVSGTRNRASPDASIMTMIFGVTAAFVARRKRPRR